MFKTTTMLAAGIVALTWAMPAARAKTPMW